MTASALSALRTIDAVLARRAAETPDALAFAEGGERLSYGGLHAEAGELAGGLAHLGVGRGDRVVLFLPAGLDFIRVFFALQRLGAAPCAFAPGGPPSAAVRRAERVRPRLTLIAGPETEGLARELTGAGLRCAELAEVSRTAPPPSLEIGEEEIAFLQPTSGTSGEARAAMITQANALASLSAARE